MRINLPTLKSRLSISTVLRAHGLTPRQNRMACPIHAGGNRSSFSIKPGDQYARCWACGWHGDVIALEHALGGGTTAEAMRRCATLAGIREPKPWERKPWLDRQRRRAERIAQAREQLLRWWRAELNGMHAAAIDDALAEVRDAGALLAQHPDKDAAWRWLERAVVARDQAEWDAIAEQHERTRQRCGGVVGGGPRI